MLGIVIRVILMPITLHPDLWGHSFAGYFFAYKGVGNIYQYLASLPATDPLVKNFGVSDIFIYPPLAYYTLGIFRLLVKPFTDPNFIPLAIQTGGNLIGNSELYWHLFLFKLPYLFVDLGLAFLLSGLFTDMKKKKLAFVLWIVNPVTLYATFMIGQLDILPTFFVVLSLYYYKKGKNTLSLLSLGVGGSYKLFPLLLIFPMAFLIADKFWPRVKALVIGFLPFALISAPFLTSPAYRQMVLFSPKSQKILFMGFNVSSAEMVFAFLLFATIIYFYSYYAVKKLRPEVYFLSILLLIFSVTHYHPQWFLWVTPLLVWQLVEGNMKYWLLGATFVVSWFIIMMFFEPSLSVGLFRPILPQLDKFPGLTDIVMKYTDVNHFKSMVRSVFAGGAAYYIYSLFREPRYQK